MKSLGAFLPWVAPHVPGASDPLIEQAVRDACIEFCDATNIVQRVEVQGVLAGEPQYVVSAPQQQRLVAVLQVAYNSNPLKYAPIDTVEHGAALRAGYDAVVDPARGTPMTYYQTTPGDDAIYLWPVPDTEVSDALAVRASFAPTRTATQVEDELFDDWLTEIVSGALARLMIIPAQPFTNPKLALEHERAFRAGVGAANAEARRGTGRGGLFVKPRPFA